MEYGVRTGVVARELIAENERFGTTFYGSKGMIYVSRCGPNENTKRY